MSHPQPRIAIIGAGLGGLTLARVLQIHNIKSTLFERDPTPHCRAQGGSLDLHPESGQYAMKTAGLYDDFLKIMRAEGQDFRLTDKDNKIVFENKAGEEDLGRPEVDRGPLRDIFLRGLEDVRWDSHVKTIKEVEGGGGGYELTFANGKKETYDLIIGADGAWSHTRSLLSPSKPAYTGIYIIELYVEDADNSHPSVSKFAGRGSFMAFSDNKALMSQRNGDGKIRVYVALRVGEDWVEESGIPWDQPTVVRERLLELYPDWNEEILQLLIQTGNAFVRPAGIYVLPPTHSWPHKTGLTLIGDAAHLMSPFAGEGANVAMQDGAELGLAIVEGLKINRKDGVEEAIEKFEKEMFKRAGGAAEESARNLELLMAPGMLTTEKWMEAMAGRIEEEKEKAKEKEKESGSRA